MSFNVRHVAGDMDSDPPLSALRVLIDELPTTDEEHPDVSVSHESGWTLSAFASGKVIWENIEDDDIPRHLDAVDERRMLAMFERLAAGDIETIESESWIPGY